MRKTTVTIMAIISLILSSCTGLKTQTPAPTFFLLHPNLVSQENRKILPVSIIVEKPEIASGLNTDKIALFTNNRRELDYFAEARWNGRLDEILQDFIIETFENSYNNIEVDSSDIHQKADYKVITKIRDFQAEYNGTNSASPLLHVAIVMSVVKLPKEDVSTRVKIDKSAQAKTNTLTSITTELESLLQKVLDESFTVLESELRK